jgi:hypothetical protein
MKTVLDASMKAFTASLWIDNGTEDGMLWLVVIWSSRFGGKNGMFTSWDATRLLKIIPKARSYQRWKAG